MQKTFDVISDPGHAWVKVPMTLLYSLCISKQISSYSYRRGAYAYLEEDCDLGVFFDAYKACYGHDPKFRERVAREKRSRVRGYDHYFWGDQNAPV